MTIYSNMIPFFLVTVLTGAGYMAYVFSYLATRPGDTPALRWSRTTAIGALVGAAAGLAGPMLFMAPLGSCTFDGEQKNIDRGFGVVLFFLGAALLLWIAKWVSRFFVGDKETRPSLTEGQTTMGVFRSNPLIPALLLLPTMIILVFFLYYPLIDTFRLSTLLVRLGAPRTKFVCVSNFTDLFNEAGFDSLTLALFVGVLSIGLAIPLLQKSQDHEGRKYLVYLATLFMIGMIFDRIMSPRYGGIMFNTFFIATSIVVIGLVLGLAVAYLAYQPVKGAMIYRTLLIWPYAVSPAIAGVIFFMLFEPVSGILNHIISLLGGTGPEWIKEPWTARATIIIASVWKTMGYNILFYIAGLQTVPNDLMEAAAIDGANAWQRFRNVVIPAISPITFFLIVTNLTYAFFNIFGTIDFLTKGGPAGASSVSIYQIYELGIRNKDLGRAAAQSLVLFLLVIAVTIFQFKTSGRRVTYGA